jgi:hypothetical protein
MLTFLLSTLLGCDGRREDAGGGIVGGGSTRARTDSVGVNGVYVLGTSTCSAFGVYKTVNAKKAFKLRKIAEWKKASLTVFETPRSIA